MARISRRSIIRKTKPMNRSNAKASMSKNIMNTDVQGIGTYTKSNKYSSLLGKKTVTGLTRRQAYKLEKDALAAQKMKISTKPEVVKAIGQAVAMNTTGAQGGLALGIADKFKQSLSQQNATTPQGSINNLIGGGANLATKDNDEEKNSTDTNENGDFSFLR